MFIVIAVKFVIFCHVLCHGFAMYNQINKPPLELITPILSWFVFCASKAETYSYLIFASQRIGVAWQPMPELHFRSLELSAWIDVIKSH